MPFPVSPNPGDSYTDAYGTVWIYAGSVNGWYRQEVIPGNETTYTGGGSGSATATGAAGEIQFTDGTNLAASPNLLWDDANDELEVTGDLKLLDGGSFTTTLQTITPTANRTVSIPDATGTLALVAGSSGQPVYNNAGAYAGLSTATIGTTGNITLSLNGAASTPPVSFTGTWFTGGTGTTTKPQLLIEPSGTTSTAWSTSGTGLGVNAASGFAGNLLDLQVNGTSQAYVLNNGRVLAKTFDSASNTFSLADSTLTLFTDVTITRDAPNTLAQRRSTNAQTFRVYNTFTSSTNYELGKLEWSSNVFRIGTEAGSGGGTKRGIEIHTGGTNRISIDASDNFTGLNLNAYNFYIGTDLQFKFGNGVFSLDSPSQIEWSSTSTAGQTPDIALKRDAAGVVKVTDGSTGNGTLLAQHRLAGTAPATSTSTGTAGDIRYDADYIYVCTATNTWKRAALATW